MSGWVPELQSERNKADKVRRLNEEVDHLAQIALASRPRERSLVSASQPQPALRNAETKEHRTRVSVMSIDGWHVCASCLKVCIIT